ncbi:MAG: hypothetical protein GWM98_18290, partial [Nitrospinaceae bacterium]|nr:hypothetical protein [Nitrospinaceae bacterium]
SLALGMLIAIPFTSEILSLLEAPMARAGLDPDAYLKVTKIAGGFSIGLRIVFWGGMILSFPAVLYFVGGFIYPGLTQKERTVISRSLGAAGVLFA